MRQTYDAMVVGAGSAAVLVPQGLSTVRRWLWAHPIAPRSFGHTGYDLAPASRPICLHRPSAWKFSDGAQAGVRLLVQPVARRVLFDGQLAAAIGLGNIVAPLRPQLVVNRPRRQSDSWFPSPSSRVPMT